MISGFLDRFRRPKGPPVPTVETPPTLQNPVSQACTQAQMEHEMFPVWCERIREKPRMHRKQWEFVYILQALADYGYVKPGMRGLGFGVGEEPLTAYFASQGVSVLATDLEPTSAAEKGWVATDQHATSKEALNARRICEAQAFNELVDFRFMDMNAIDRDLDGQFDFCWSACALEHLGSIENGLKFIENSIAALKPGGIAVHTTEFNCASNDLTLDHTSTVLFRRRDFEKLAQTLLQQGCSLTFNFNLGDQPLDQHIDMPPYAADNHLKLKLSLWTTTSFGIIIHKGANG